VRDMHVAIVTSHDSASRPCCQVAAADDVLYITCGPAGDRCDLNDELSTASTWRLIWRIAPYTARTSTAAIYSPSARRAIRPSV